MGVVAPGEKRIRTDFFYITKIGPVFMLLPVDIIHILCGIFQLFQVNPEKIHQNRSHSFQFFIQFVIKHSDVNEEELRRKKNVFINKQPFFF